MRVSLERQDMRTDAGEEEPGEGNDHRATGEIQRWVVSFPNVLGVFRHMISVGRVGMP